MEIIKLSIFAKVVTTPTNQGITLNKNYISKTDHLLAELWSFTGIVFTGAVIND